MSRPCFALSVMLCCMVGPLMIIGKTHAQDGVVSPNHDPGECIVCPLAHGPLEPCGGYSDYDYNSYHWYDSYSPPSSEPTSAADPELEVAQSPADGATEEAWESGYDDYYADYVYGDDTTTTNTEPSTLEETSAPAAAIDPDAEAAPAPDALQAEDDLTLVDEYGWDVDDADASADYFDTYENYEPVEPIESDAAPLVEATPEEGAIDYEAYEEEWFSYGEETPIEAQEVSSDADETIAAPTASETWGDEEAWYYDEYGYDAAFEEGIQEASPSLEAAEQLETGYDQAYDAAMTPDLEAAEPVADIVPADIVPADIVPAAPEAAAPEAESIEADDYETFYDAYEDLYNFEDTPAEPSGAAETLESETSEATVEPAIEQPADAEPAWLAELAERVQIAFNAQELDRDSYTASYADECAQEWDCEAESCPAGDAEPAWLGEFVERVQIGFNASEPERDWHAANDEDERAQEWESESDYGSRSQPDEPAAVLGVADTLDGMASALKNATEYLRGVIGGHLAETARSSNGGVAR